MIWKLALLISMTVMFFNFEVPKALRAPANINQDYKSARTIPGANGPWESPGFNYAKCMDKTSNKTTYPFDKRGNFLKECAPEVLYSWQSEEMLGIYTKGSTPQKVLPVERTFAWRTPIGSFGYGVAPLRMKLKPTVAFVEVPFKTRQWAYNNIGWYGKDKREATCKYWKDYLKAPAQTVFVMIHGDNRTTDERRIQEYVLCDSEAIESWSVATPELLQEMQWELDQVLGREKLSDTDVKYDAFSQDLKFPWNYPFDRLAWDESGLVRSINWLQRSIIEKKYSDIYYAEGVKPDRESHFTVAHPNYYLRRPELKGDERKIINVQISAIDADGKLIISDKTELLNSSCVDKPYCYWNAGLDITRWGLPKAVSTFGIDWTCEGSDEVFTIQIQPSSLGVFRSKENDLLQNQFQIQCVNPGSTIVPAPKPLPAPVPIAEVGAIKIQSATYATKKDEYDVTSYVSSFCNAKTSCLYKISSRNVGLGKSTSKTTFKVTYLCGTDPKPITLDVPRDAENQIWDISCKEAPKKISP